MEKLRILFLGTPDFALFSLRALSEAGYEIVGVVTQPDKPKGRGYELLPPPVKVFALEKGLSVYQPNTLRDEAFAELLSGIDPNLIVVVAYGKILPENVLDYPKFGCINVHGSLLPEYRGAAPMQRAIIDGKKMTGITTMKMEAGLDTGEMYEKAALAIGENDNFEVVHDALGELGAKLLLSTIQKLEAGQLKGTPQDDSKATYAKKIEKEDCRLDFSGSATKLHNLIRGLSPMPLAVTTLPDGKLLKVVESRVSDLTLSGAPGTILSTDGGKITVACGCGAIDLLTLIPEGKKKMSAKDLINGRRVSVGDRLGDSCG
ncbi:MAG: methionyl-tRNA formyltransferase [Clostridia bacterium]|nr:methionyl-tRNA formyltransferase [Clostridia bacterium]